MPRPAPNFGRAAAVRAPSRAAVRVPRCVRGYYPPPADGLHFAAPRHPRAAKAATKRPAADRWLCDAAALRVRWLPAHSPTNPRWFLAPVLSPNAPDRRPDQREWREYGDRSYRLRPAPPVRTRARANSSSADTGSGALPNGRPGHGVGDLPPAHGLRCRLASVTYSPSGAFAASAQ